MKNRVGLVLLNKNEYYSLKDLIPIIPMNLFDDVFAVDGGSTDQSLSLFDSYNILVLNQTSRGRGEAFKLAFERARRQKLNALVFFSTDGNEDSSSLHEFIPLLNKGFDLVIASRMMKGGVNEEDNKILRFRKWGNILFSWMAYLSFGFWKKRKRITDPINGFRAISLRAWDSMNAKSSGFSIEYETSIKSYKLGLRVEEFPTHERQRKYGKSSATAWATTKAMLLTYIENLGR